MSKILIVEDNPANMRLVVVVMENAGHQVLQSENAVEGIRLAREAHPDLIFMDIQLPDMAGYICASSRDITDIEFGLIKTHAEAGYEIIKAIAFPWPIADMVRQHHERLDGSGYPQGLKGDQIRLEPRILAVADIVEAMSANRPYRPGLGMGEALNEVMRYRGAQPRPRRGGRLSTRRQRARVCFLQGMIFRSNG